VFSAWSVSRGYEKDKEDRLKQLSFENSACQDMNLGAEKLELSFTPAVSPELRIDGEKGIRRRKEDFMCAAVTVRLL
jgi:hypothetical protein